MKEAIDKTRKYLRSGENPLFWSLYIIRELCKYDFQLAIQWAAECIRIRLSECEPEQVTRLDKYIGQTLDVQDITTSECDEIARKIWYLKPGREPTQTAVARLWWALGYFIEENKDRGIREIESLIWLVSTEHELVTLDILKRRYINNYRLSELYIEAALRIYKDY